MIAAELDSAELAKLTVAEMLKRRILINCTAIPCCASCLRTSWSGATSIRRLTRWTKFCGTRRGAQCARRRTTSWLAKPPWNAGKPPFPLRKTPTFWPRAAACSGEDLCSIADLSSGECAASKLGHDVKHNPREYAMPSMPSRWC